MKKVKVNLYSGNYEFFVEFAWLCGHYHNLSPMEVIDAILSDQNADKEAQLLCKWMREYTDKIPYKKEVKNELLNFVLPVGDIEKWKKWYRAFRSTKDGHQSKDYNSINSYKLILALIKRGIFPQKYFQTMTSRREGGSFAQMTKAQQDSRELQSIQCIDHAALTNPSQSAIFLEIFDRTGLTPRIELRNAHTGKNACFLIVSLLDVESNSFSLKNSYSEDSIFGVRIEHKSLGENYELLESAVDKIASFYPALLELITFMQSHYLTEDEKVQIKEGLLDILFPHRKLIPTRYECNLDFLFQIDQRLGAATMWDYFMNIRDITDIQKKGIPYTIIEADGKVLQRTKKLREPKKNSYNSIPFWNRRRDQFFAAVFELFISIVENRQKNA